VNTTTTENMNAVKEIVEEVIGGVEAEIVASTVREDYGHWVLDTGVAYEDGQTLGIEVRVGWRTEWVLDVGKQWALRAESRIEAIEDGEIVRTGYFIGPEIGTGSGDGVSMSSIGATETTWPIIVEQVQLMFTLKTAEQTAREHVPAEVEED
jgi:hypothetical protein